MGMMLERRGVHSWEKWWECTSVAEWELRGCFASGAS